MSIRKPPSLLVNPQYIDLPSGTVLHRVHKSTFSTSEFNPGRGSPTRFASFADDTGTTVPSLYAASTVRAAIHETISCDIPASARLRTVLKQNVLIRTHSEIKTVRRLKLVELRDVTLGNSGISRRELISSSSALYHQTVKWAHAIHRDVSDAEGLVWTSNQCDPDNADLSFGDRVDESDFAAMHLRDGALDKSFLNDVRSEGRLRGITLTV